jgi:hypothetical protein
MTRQRMAFSPAIAPQPSLLIGIKAPTTSFSGSLGSATGHWQWRMASMSAPKLASRSCSRLAAFRPTAPSGRISPAAAPAGRSLAFAQTARHLPPRCRQRQPPSVAASSPSAETAATAEIGDYVECYYSVQLEDGTVADSSDAAGEQACFILGGWVDTATCCSCLLLSRLLLSPHIPRNRPRAAGAGWWQASIRQWEVWLWGSAARCPLPLRMLMVRQQ